MELRRSLKEALVLEFILRVMNSSGEVYEGLLLRF